MEKKVDNYKSKKAEINEKFFSIEKRPIFDILKGTISNISVDNKTWILTSDLKILDITHSKISVSPYDLFYDLFRIMFSFTSSISIYSFNYSTYYSNYNLISCPCRYQTPFSERRLPIIRIMYNVFDKLEDNFIDIASNNLLFTEIKNDRNNKLISKLVRKRIHAEWENYILGSYYNDF